MSQNNNNSGSYHEQNVGMPGGYSSNQNQNQNPLNANISSFSHQQPSAHAMRSGMQNPHGSNYEVAGPTMGGTASPYDPEHIEVAKEHLADSLNNTHISGNSADVHEKSLTDSVVSGASTAASTAATVASTAASGAVAAGAAVLNAGKKLFSHDTGVAHVDSPHPHPVATIPSTSMASTTVHAPSMANADTEQTIHIASAPTQSTYSAAAPTYSTYSAAAPAVVEPRLSTGLNKTPAVQTHQARPQLHSMKGEQVSTAGVIGAASAYSAAPPLHDTIRSTTDIPPTAPGQASPALKAHSHSYYPASAQAEHKDEDLIKGTSTTSTTTTTTTDAPHHHEGITDKVKNVFRRRGSAEAEMDQNLETGNHHVAAQTASVAVPAATASAPVVKHVQHTTEIRPESGVTHSGLPKADLHATAGVPATKVDVRPTTTLNQGYNAKSPSLAEKITAPVAGAAAAVGAAAAGTAAFIGNKAHDAKEAVKDSVDHMTGKDSTTTTQSTYTAPTTTQSTYTAPVAPAVNTTYAAPIVNTVSVPVVNTTHTAPSAPIMGEKITTTTTEYKDSRPLTEKVTAPVAGAAAAVGAAAAGTAAFIGNKAHDAKEAVKDSVNNMTSKGNTATTTQSTYTAPAVNVSAPSATPATMSTTTTTTAKAAEPIIHTASTTTQATTAAAPAIPAPTVSTSVSGNTQTTVKTEYVPAKEAKGSIVQKIVAPVAAAAAGTAAFVGHKAHDVKETVSHMTEPSSTVPPKAPVSSATKTITTTTGTAAAAPMTAASTTSNTYQTTTTTGSAAAAPMAAGTIGAAGMNSGISASSTTIHLDTPEKIKASVPASYHGPIPTVHEGEEVVWVKTVTTTDFYDTDKGPDMKGDVVETHQNVLDPNRFGTEKDGATTYVNKNGHEGPSAGY